MPKKKITKTEKLKIPSRDRIFNMDPAGFAPASLGANANMLLHTIRARIRDYLKLKEILLQGFLFSTQLDPLYTNHVSVYTYYIDIY